MNKRTKQRLAEVQRAIGSRPIARELRRQCFEHFRNTGELPEDHALAVAVCERVKAGHEIHYLGGQVDLAKTIRASMSAALREHDPFMDTLLDEAVHGTDLVRDGAREALKVLADVGVDVTTTPFAGKECVLPEYGSLGMHLLGYPRFLVRRPYMRQARRVIARAEDLRPRLPHDDRAWFEQLGEAAARLVAGGDLPTDDLMLESVLVMGELWALTMHFGGHPVKAEMAGFDEIARTKGEARQVAIAKLQAVFREGRLLPVQA